jgi:hypothetical protein
LIVKPANLAVAKKAKSVKDIQLVDQLWLNVRLLRKRKRVLNVLAGKTEGLKNQQEDLQLLEDRVLL